MEFARNHTGKLVCATHIHAEGAMHRSYTCHYCKHPVHIVRCVKKSSHFRHGNGHSCQIDSDYTKKNEEMRCQTQNTTSPFHMHWTNLFPKECVEIPVGVDCRSDCVPQSLDGLKRCIEFQHSNISSDEVQRRNTAYVRAGFELTWIVDIQDHCLVPEVITFEASVPNEIRRARFLKLKSDDLVSNALSNICGADSHSSIVILLDPGFNTGMPLLKVLQPDTLREDGLIYYTEMDRQEFLTSMGLCPLEKQPNIVQHVEALPSTRYIDYGQPLDEIHDVTVKSHLADMFRFVETLPISFWLADTFVFPLDDNYQINYMCNGPYTGSWRFTGLAKMVGITSSYSAHAYMALKLFLKNLEAIAFTSTVTFGKYNGKTISKVPTHYLKWMLDKQADYKHNLHLLEFRKLYALRMLTRLSHYDPDSISPIDVQAMRSHDSLTGLQTVVQIWKAVDNGVQVDSRGKRASGEDNILVYNPDEHVRMPFHKFKEEFSQRYNAGCVRSARLRDFEKIQRFKRDQAEEDRLRAISDRAHNAKVYEEKRLDAIQNCKKKGFASMDAFLGLSSGARGTSTSCSST